MSLCSKPSAWGFVAASMLLAASITPGHYVFDALRAPTGCVSVHKDTTVQNVAYAFFLALGHEPVPVDVIGLHSGGEVAAASVAALALHVPTPRFHAQTILLHPFEKPRHPNDRRNTCTL